MQIVILIKIEYIEAERKVSKLYIKHLVRIMILLKSRKLNSL